MIAQTCSNLQYQPQFKSNLNRTLNYSVSYQNNLTLGISSIPFYLQHSSVTSLSYQYKRDISTVFHCHTRLCNLPKQSKFSTQRPL